jgi:hypothetical protein
MIAKWREGYEDVYMVPQTAGHDGLAERGLLRAVVLALDTLSAFSNLPLRLWGMVGAVIAGLSLLYSLARIVRHFVHGIDVPGYESIIVAVLFLGGVQLLSMGILGGYIGRIFNEVKHRPLYFVRETYGVEKRG